MPFARAILVVAVAAAAIIVPRTPARADDLSGEWKVTFEGGGQAVDYTLTLRRDGDKLSGDLVSPRSGNRYPLEEVSFKDGVLRASVPAKEAKLTAKLEGDRLTGTIEIPAGEGTLKATRTEGAGKPSKDPKEAKKELPGTWNATAVLPNGRELASKLVVEAREGKLSGKFSSERGDMDIDSVKRDGDKVVLGFKLPINGETREFKIEASFDGAERLKGRWAAADDSASGEWSAKKEPRKEKPKDAKLAARYLIEAKVSDGSTVRSVLEPRVEGAKVTGSYTPRGGDKADIRGSYEGGHLEFSMEVPYQGELRRVKVSGDLDEGGMLKGTFSSEGGSGDWTGRPVADL